MIQQLQHNTTKLLSARSSDPIVLCAADEHYVKPLAVTLHSAASHLGAGHHLHIVLMDGGITDSSFEGLRETLTDLPISIHTLKFGHDEVSDLMTSHHITHTAYFRLLAGRLLPEEIERVIYLDSDVLVQDDLSKLWNLPLHDQYCLAAVDIACPFIDAYQTQQIRPEIKRSIPFLAAISPVPNWRQLQLDPAQPYFNSGVMVLNLARWRREQIDRQLLACLRNNSSFVWCWDQYALNVVFAEQWGQLPANWNQGAHVFEYPDPSFSPIATDDFLAMRDQPSIIHFTTEFKPWKYEPFHPLRDQFFEQLDQTAWNGWRPEKPPFSLRRWWDLQAVHWIRAGVIRYRKLKLLTR
ncbi:MAG: glycosyltransferase family 8 protein [Planctomycetota bacterium]